MKGQHILINGNLSLINGKLSLINGKYQLFLISRAKVLQ